MAEKAEETNARVEPLDTTPSTEGELSNQGTTDDATVDNDNNEPQKADTQPDLGPIPGEEPYNPADDEIDLAKKWEEVDRKRIEIFNSSIKTQKNQALALIAGMGVMYIALIVIFIKASLPLIAALIAFLGVFFIFMTISKSFKGVFSEKPKIYVPDREFLNSIKDIPEVIPEEALVSNDNVAGTDDTVIIVDDNHVDQGIVVEEETIVNTEDIEDDENTEETTDESTVES